MLSARQAVLLPATDGALWRTRWLTRPARLISTLPARAARPGLPGPRAPAGHSREAPPRAARVPAHTCHQHACRALPRAVRARKSAVAGAAAAPPPHPGDDVSQLGGVVEHDDVIVQRQVDVCQAAVVGWRLLKGQLAWQAGGQSGKGGARVNNFDHEGKPGWRPTARSPAAPPTAASLRRTLHPPQKQNGIPFLCADGRQRRPPEYT